MQICVFLPTAGGGNSIFHQTQHQKSHPCTRITRSEWTKNVTDTPNSASSSPKPSSKAKKAKKAGRRLTGVVNVNDLGDDDDDDEDEDEAFAHRKVGRVKCSRFSTSIYRVL